MDLTVLQSNFEPPEQIKQMELAQQRGSFEYWIVVADSGRGGNGPLVATHAGTPREPVTPPVTATVALPTVPSGTPTTTGPPQTPTQPPPATSTTPAPGGLTPWPANQNGYTVVLASVPSDNGRATAVQIAKRALSQGLPEVGILDSKDFAGLHPGYFVVFSGVYTSNADASSHLRQARAAGYAASYARQITR